MPTDKRATQALTMLRTLNAATSGDITRWCSIDVIDRSVDDLEALRYTMDQHWLEVAPGAHSVRITAAGRHAIE